MGSAPMCSRTAQIASKPVTLTPYCGIDMCAAGSSSAAYAALSPASHARMHALLRPNNAGLLAAAAAVVGIAANPRATNAPRRNSIVVLACWDDNVALAERIHSPASLLAARHKMKSTMLWDKAVYFCRFRRNSPCNNVIRENRQLCPSTFMRTRAVQKQGCVGIRHLCASPVFNTIFHPIS